jgi:quercetin dioxygenase-like cupin family protein
MHDDSVAKRARLTDLVQFQDGSVVSRSVLKKDSGSVTLFAFAEGESLSEHTVPYDALVYIAEGEARIAVSDAVHDVKGGELLLLPAGVPHSLQAVSEFKMMLVMLRS